VNLQTRRPSTRHVTVILGDPDLPDSTKIGQRYSPEDLEAVARMKSALGELTGYRWTYLSHHGDLLSKLLAHPPSFVFNLCDTGYRNDANRELHLPALLELLEVPYTGCGPTCLGLCYDKSLVRSIAAGHGVPVPQETYWDPEGEDLSLPSAYPVLIKPNNGDGSLGITQGAVVRSHEEATRYGNGLSKQFPGRAVLVQEFLSGPEYGVALIGNPDAGFTVLPPLEVDYSALDPGLPPILSYESKTMPQSPYWTKIKFREARLGARNRDQLVGYAKTLFKRLGCRDYARFDFRSDGAETVKLLEANPNPAWCWDGKLNIMAEFAGYRYDELFQLILAAAEARIAAGGARENPPGVNRPAIKPVDA